ncbi:hypothetical protein ALC62_11788 [Cyphomyrmex costatus]|uniref:Uncharacterized protein n=1 Tax=Cyphomyrmex costatus TaxID=456900 RepID=A0A195C9V6_9HYME|nr:hypothetical protein ALC62_11788 [Cyphomyrmex costatus]
MRRRRPVYSQNQEVSEMVCYSGYLFKIVNFTALYRLKEPLFKRVSVCNICGRSRPNYNVPLFGENLVDQYCHGYDVQRGGERRVGGVGGGWLAGWLTGWLTGWLAGSLAGWLLIEGWLLISRLHTAEGVGRNGIDS